MDTTNRYMVRDYLILIILICISLACKSSKESPKLMNVPKANIEENSEQTNLVIEWYGDSIEMDEVNIKLSHKLPIATEEPATVYVGVYIGVLPLTTIRRSLPILNTDLDYVFKENVKANTILKYTIADGDYFLSIDTDEYKRFRFYPVENKRMIAAFGFSANENSGEAKNLEYNGICTSRYGGIYTYAHINYSKCKKVKIMKGKQTVIRISYSNRKWEDFGTIFLKVIPGIPLLSHCTNLLGYYTYRDFNIELMNPEDRNINE